MSEHADLVLLHENMFKNIEKQLETLIKVDELRNGKYDKHIEESIVYRKKVERHDVVIEELEDLKKWLVGTIITIILAGVTSIGIWLFTLGHMDNQIKINTERLNVIESIHPRTDSK